MKIPPTLVEEDNDNFSNVCSLPNLLYKQTVELTFEKFFQLNDLKDLRVQEKRLERERDAQEKAAMEEVYTLQHTATHCNTLQHTATHCSTLQHTATPCNTLQHTATHCDTL